MPACIDNEKCTGCEACIQSCPSEAIGMNDDKANVDCNICTDCGVCVDECPVEAIAMKD